MRTAFTCPNCEHTNTVELQEAPHETTCSSCRATLQVPSQGEVKGMPSVTCACGARHAVKSRKESYAITCPNCNQSVIVPPQKADAADKTTGAEPQPPPAPPGSGDKAPQPVTPSRLSQVPEPPPVSGATAVATTRTKAPPARPRAEPTQPPDTDTDDTDTFQPSRWPLRVGLGAIMTVIVVGGLFFLLDKSVIRMGNWQINLQGFSGDERVDEKPKKDQPRPVPSTTDQRLERKAKTEPREEETAKEETTLAEPFLASLTHSGKEFFAQVQCRMVWNPTDGLIKADCDTPSGLAIAYRNFRAIEDRYLMTLLLKRGKLKTDPIVAHTEVSFGPLLLPKEKRGAKAVAWPPEKTAVIFFTGPPDNQAP